MLALSLIWWRGALLLLLAVALVLSGTCQFPLFESTLRSGQLLLRFFPLSRLQSLQLFLLRLFRLFLGGFSRPTSLLLLFASSALLGIEAAGARNVGESGGQANYLSRANESGFGYLVISFAAAI